MALAMVLVAFAQKESFQSTKLDQPNVTTEKTQWYGHLNSNTVFTNFTQGTVVAYRYAANELPVGGQLEKVLFHAYKSWENVNYNTNFVVKVYTGGNGAWLADSTYTADLTTCGTVVAQQNYTLTEDGDQIVTLNTPVTIPQGQEVWIAVECLGTSVLAFDAPEYDENASWSTTSIWYRYYTDDAAYFWVVPGWCEDQQCTIVNRSAEWHMGCYVNDGQDPVFMSDMAVYFFDPFVTGQNIITEQVINEDYEYDSLYVCFAMFNLGIDSANYPLIHLTGEIVGVEDYWLDWNYANYAEVADRYIPAGRGPIWGNIADDGMEEGVALMGLDELADFGLSYPFDVCINVDFAGNDPDLTNNHKCMTFTDQHEPGVGIQENANNAMSVYPNPANNVITVANAAGAQISIYNLAGQQVANIASASANQTINVANLSEGLYVIRVANGNQVSTSKFSVVR